MSDSRKVKADIRQHPTRESIGNAPVQPVLVGDRSPAWWAALDRDRKRWLNDRDRCQDCGLVEACRCGTQWADEIDGGA